MVMAWTPCICCWNVFFKTDKSVIATQRPFHAHFMLFQNNALLDRKFATAMIWKFYPEQFSFFQAFFIHGICGIILKTKNIDDI